MWVYGTWTINCTLFAIALVLLVSTADLAAQSQWSPQEQEEVHDRPFFRIAGLIGHTVVQTHNIDAHVLIPSWGLDIEYWFSPEWGVGVHNDLEIESLIVVNNKEEQVERINPFVLTADLLYHIRDGWVLVAGPGVELVGGERYALGRIGVEYELRVGNHIDISPTIFMDHRVDGITTYTFGLAIGKGFYYERY